MSFLEGLKSLGKELPKTDKQPDEITPPPPPKERKPRKAPIPPPEPEDAELAPLGGAIINLDQRRIWETVYLLVFGHRWQQATSSKLPGLKQEFYKRLKQKLETEGVI